jgi:hypothetical protein
MAVCGRVQGCRRVLFSEFEVLQDEELAVTPEKLQDLTGAWQGSGRMV